MGTAGRLTHHVLVSRRRTHRRRPTLRRVHHWPVAALSGHEDDDEGRATGALVSQLDIPSRFLTPISETMLAPTMALSPTAGQVKVAAVIELESAEEAARRNSVLDMPLAKLDWQSPFEWLSLGWRDFTRTPLIGLFYGACFVLMGWLLVACFHEAPEYSLALCAGFLLLGPFLCLGLYEVSRRIERGEAPNLWSSLTAWRTSSSQLAIFACVLLVLEMLWGRAAMIVFAISFEGVPDFNGPLSSFMTEEYLTFFAAYMAVGALFAGLIYAISAISMPMLLDRPVDAISAGLASMRLVTTQMGVMLLWGALITLLVLMAMLPGFLGLLVIGPVLGHASWHAYRAATSVGEKA
jgi:uncharacterized membrane protein